MKHINKSEFEAYERLYKINLLNSCSGFKSANLIGTRSSEGNDNVAIFSSVIHLGSSPALLGFIMRPTTVPRNTLENIIDTGFYTINHVSSSILEQAHQTSAKYAKEVSEFKETGLNPIIRNGFHAPFVKESPVQMAMKFVEELPIKRNGTILVIGEILDIYFEDEMLEDDGFLNLSTAGVLAINGLDAYCQPALIQRQNYARP
ncbi:flavin reductase family protein [Arcticibacterium luteifluviistationis]|uniref:Flavin oxidoreductase n=1 Tax=Arcticibacterium luteifluviistationis TaxID=1784714 RepID=A0A2Z4G8S1_9BACT|nr:flavin reductase [Arcticibacterium luteifluviistationis]AWV97554.1 flavin oxidoreductase [Arcticibacterium luteifluviistationis]